MIRSICSTPLLLPYVSDPLPSIVGSRVIRCLVPENCSQLFRYTIESLFITHAATQLNTFGNVLVDARAPDPYPMNNPWLTRGKEWCQGLRRRPRPT